MAVNDVFLGRAFLAFHEDVFHAPDDMNSAQPLTWDHSEYCLLHRGVGSVTSPSAAS